MTVTIRKELREMLQKLHALEVENTRPFIERDGKTHMRFDRITLESPRAGLLVMTYSWRGLEVYHLNVAIVDKFSQTITMENVTGELEVQLL